MLSNRWIHVKIFFAVHWQYVRKVWPTCVTCWRPWCSRNVSCYVIWLPVCLTRFLGLVCDWSKITVISCLYLSIIFFQKTKTLTKDQEMKLFMSWCVVDHQNIRNDVLTTWWSVSDIIVVYTIIYVLRCQFWRRTHLKHGIVAWIMWLLWHGATQREVRNGGLHRKQSWHIEMRQNGHHFIDNIFEYIFLHENCCILIQISVK